MSIAREHYQNIVENLYDGVYTVDRDRVITYWNKGAERITGYSSDHVVGRSCRDNLLNHVNADGVPQCNKLCPLAGCMTEGSVHEAELFLHHAEGHRAPVLVRCAPLRNAQRSIVGAVEIFSSGTGLMAARKELRTLRHTIQMDMLTGIGNRRYVEGQLRGTLAQFDGQPCLAGLLFIDIDHFKQLNDNYGHDVGDRALRMVASTLEQSLRKSDVVGRWGGEEFLAILYNEGSPEGLKSAADKLRTLVERSWLDLPDCKLRVTISVGGTLFQPADTPDTIVSRADNLMYKSKKAGRNAVCVG